MLSVLKVRIYSYFMYFQFVNAWRHEGDKIKLVIQMMSNTIGNNIKKLRKENEVKQAVLAYSLNLSRQTLSSYERGITLPNIFILIQIADYFGITLDELAGRTDPLIFEKTEMN